MISLGTWNGHTYILKHTLGGMDYYLLYTKIITIGTRAEEE